MSSRCPAVSSGDCASRSARPFSCHASRGFHRRDTLLGLFWPEADTGHAHGSLRQAVRFLRRSLGDDVVRSRGDDDLALGEGVLECDAVAFEAALAEARERVGDHRRLMQRVGLRIMPPEPSTAPAVAAPAREARSG